MADIAANNTAKRVDKVVYSRKHKPNRVIARDSVVT